VAGTVHLDVLISADGAVRHVAVARSSSHPVLDDAAVESVRALRPVPFPAGLAPRALRVRMPVVFDLR
jgi:protein TonB